MNEQGKGANNKAVSNILIGALIGIAVVIIFLGAQGTVALRTSRASHGTHAKGHNFATHGHTQGLDCELAVKIDGVHHNNHGDGCSHHAVSSDAVNTDCAHSSNNDRDCDKKSGTAECLHKMTNSKYSCGRCDHKTETDRID